MTVRVITEPTAEPITLAEAKLFLRETQSDQDAVIALLITAARQYGENLTHRAFMPQTLELTLPCFPCDNGRIVLPNPPLVSVTSVKYIDSSGTLQTVDPAQYQVDSYSEPGEIKPAYQCYWQQTRSDYNAVQVRYVAGYPETGSPALSVPGAIKQWLKMRVAQLYEHREAMVVGTIVSPLPRNFVDALLDPFCTSTFG